MKLPHTYSRTQRANEREAKKERYEMREGGVLRKKHFIFSIRMRLIGFCVVNTRNDVTRTQEPFFLNDTKKRSANICNDSM